MQRRVQLELADQCVSQVLHLGQIRALIVVQHTAENIDFQKCFAQLCFFLLLIWSTNDISPKFRKRNLIGISTALCKTKIA